MPNLYLIQKNDNTGDEVSADFYERQGDDWVFLLGGSEVARLEIESIVSIAKAPRDLSWRFGRFEPSSVGITPQACAAGPPSA